MAKNEKKKKKDPENLSYPDLTKELDRKRVRALRRRTEAAQAGEFSFSAEPAPFGETEVILETEPVPDVPEEQEKRPANIHAGHRARLRERFRKEGGFDHFQDHEILELILTYGAPRGDMNGIAHELLDTFGSLKAVFEARRAYKRAWNKKNPDKNKEYQRKYWERKAQREQAEKEAAGNGI